MPRNKNIKRVAKTVIAQIQKGKRPNVKEAMLEVGYSRSTAEKKQGDVTSHKEYKEVMFSFRDRLEKAINDAMDNIDKRADSANYRDSVSAVDIMNKQLRLIEGKTTENHGISGILDSLE